jgi:hypothetical protein
LDGRQIIFHTDPEENLVISNEINLSIALVNHFWNFLYTWLLRIYPKIPQDFLKNFTNYGNELKNFVNDLIDRKFFDLLIRPEKSHLLVPL